MSARQRIARKEVRDFVRKLEAVGAEVCFDRNGHLAVYWDGRRVGSIPSTPGDRRSLKNTASFLRRQGVPI